MKVSRYAYHKQFGDQADGLFDDLKNMILKGEYILSDTVYAFLKNFSSFLECDHACGTNSGTDALILALKALDIGIGDEVITQANTFNATVTAIKSVGAIPVLVDIDQESYLMNAIQVEKCITAKTKVIIPVHLYGKPTNIKPIMTLSSKYGLDIVEDCAQAHGAKIDDQFVGSFGRIGCFSFHPSKNLPAAGDAGCIVTNDAELNEKCQWIASLGQKGQNEHVVPGFNSKMDSIQAKVLSWKLPFLKEWNVKRNSIAEQYIQALNDLPITFQQRSANEQHVYHLFTIRTEKRDELQTFLKRKEIDAVVRYPTPIHLQRAFSKEKWKKGQFPVAEALSQELLCLPIRPDMTADEVNYVSDTIRQFFYKN